MDSSLVYWLRAGYLGRSPVMNSMRVLHAIRSLRFISALPGLQTVIRTVVYSIPGGCGVMWQQQFIWQL